MNARIILNGETKGRPYEMSMIIDNSGKLISIAGVIKAKQLKAFYYEPEKPMSLERYGRAQQKLGAELIKFLHGEVRHENSHADRVQRAALHRKTNRLQADKTVSAAGTDQPEK